MTSTKIDTYLDELRAALEVRGTSDDQITDILRQARSHLIDTREDPYETFGSPRDYAKQYAPHSTATRYWLFVISSVALATGGGWILVNGIINFIGETTVLWRLSPLVGIVAGSLLIALWIVNLVVAGTRHARRNRN